MSDVIDFADKGVFAETDHQLWPVQRVVLKAIYGIELDCAPIRCTEKDLNCHSVL